MYTAGKYEPKSIEKLFKCKPILVLKVKVKKILYKSKEILFLTLTFLDKAVEGALILKAHL